MYPGAQDFCAAVEKLTRPMRWPSPDYLDGSVCKYQDLDEPRVYGTGHWSRSGLLGVALFMLLNYVAICAWYYIAKDARNDMFLLAGSLPAMKRTFWRD